MTSHERERAMVHAGLIRELMVAHKGSLRDGAVILQLPDEELVNSTWILADKTDDPHVTGVLWGAGVYAPPVPVLDKFREELLDYIRAFGPGIMPGPTKETDMKRQKAVSNDDSVREEVK